MTSSLRTSTPVRLFVDDVRFPPDKSWRLVRTAEEALAVMRASQIDTVSLDFDLNLREISPGVWREFAARDGLWLVERMIEERLIWRIPHILVHSANPVGGARMRARLLDAMSA
jgi:hypothetical protein